MTNIPRFSILLTSAVAMLVLGLTFGAMVGLSNTPVVGVALPLIFSVAGGASGLYLVKFDAQDPASAFRIVSLSLSITAVSVGTLIGMWFGLSLRSPTIESWSVVTSDEHGELRSSVTGDVLHKLMLDAKLVQLRLNRNEVR